jgi:hypothetical protein
MIFMGFFDRFKKCDKQNESNVANNRQQVTQLPFDIEYKPTLNGNLQVEFYDNDRDFKKFYDTTRLIIGRQPLNIEGHQVYNCAVSWYGQNDCQILDKKTGLFDSLRAQEYRGVLAEIDLELLQTDPNYCNMVMKELLDKQRVERYLESGLQETPEQPCGKYIGGVRQTERGYGKFFSTVVGRASHNSDLMINRRKEHREMIELQRQNAIENKKAQIKKLQSELDSMER